LLSHLQVAGQQEAWKQCCTMNMNLLQFETRAEYDCLRPAFKSNYFCYCSSLLFKSKICVAKKLNLSVLMAAYRTYSSPPMLYRDYFTGLLNYGCPEVFAWCPSRVAFQFNFYSYPPYIKAAGVLSVESSNDILDSNYLIRLDSQLLSFMCESK
jgi:hypothetical protein